MPFSDQVLSGALVMIAGEPFVIIVGSPRSGTTVLGETLGKHPEVANWYEPYFVWDRYFGNMDSDARPVDLLTDRARSCIRREFEIFLGKSGASILIDKSPEHCFKIPMVNAVFPDAKWISLIRDGRDTVLSIKREWEKRQSIVSNKSFAGLWPVVMEMMSLQPYWRNRFQAVRFELLNASSLNPLNFLNKSKWEGGVGWGPRFPGWREARASMSILEFNALQWKKSVEQSGRDLAAEVSDHRKIEVRYEKFIENGEKELQRIFDFLGVDYNPSMSFAKDLMPENKNKWRGEFDNSQLAAIGPIIADLLIETGYEKDNSWFTRFQDG